MTTRTNVRECPVCRQVAKRDGNWRYCWDCYRRFAPLAPRAVYLVHKAVLMGRLPRASSCTCVDCGKPAHEYDHRDYAKPLDVVPLCRSCNKLRGPAIQWQPRAAA